MYWDNISVLHCIQSYKYTQASEQSRVKRIIYPLSVFRIEAWYQLELAQASNMMAYTVHFLLMELQSVGNIRLEEGCPTDPW